MERQEANDDRVLIFGSAETIAFVCECADDNCKRTVILSPGAFNSRREHGELILYQGHVPLADG
jgi:hypothetical protein